MIETTQAINGKPSQRTNAEIINANDWFVTFEYVAVLNVLLHISGEMFDQCVIREDLIRRVRVGVVKLFVKFKI